MAGKERLEFKSKPKRKKGKESDITDTQLASAIARAKILQAELSRLEKEDKDFDWGKLMNLRITV